MRKIKLRAWDKISKVMYGDKDAKDLLADGVQNIIFMESIGLHDKKGKEIFEKDIIEYDNGYIEIVEDLDPIHESITHESILYGEASTGNYSLIKGNIFQNPIIYKRLFNNE